MEHWVVESEEASEVRIDVGNEGVDGILPVGSDIQASEVFENVLNKFAEYDSYREKLPGESI